MTIVAIQILTLFFYFIFWKKTRNNKKPKNYILDVVASFSKSFPKNFKLKKEKKKEKKKKIHLIFSDLIIIVEGIGPIWILKTSHQATYLFN